MGETMGRKSPPSLIRSAKARPTPLRQWTVRRSDLLARLARDAADMQTIVHEQCGIGLPLFTGYNDGHVGRLKGLRPIPTGPLMGFTFAENVWLES